MSYKLEPAIWSHDTGQQIAWFDSCQLIITWCHISTKYTVNQGCMSLSTYYLEYDRHVARLHRRRHRRAYAHTKNTAGHDNMRKSIHGFPLFSYLGTGLRWAALWDAGAPLWICRLKGILAKKQFCSESQAGVCVLTQTLLQQLKVDNSLPVLNARLFLSAILGFQLSREPPCLFLQSLMGHYDVNVRLDVFEIRHCLNLEI